MGYSRTKALAVVVSITVGGCATPPPFPLLGQARDCIERAENRTDGEPGGPGSMRTARDRLEAAQAGSKEQERKHLAYMALQQCRTALAQQAARKSTERIAAIDRDRLHLKAGLRGRLRQIAKKERNAFITEIAVDTYGDSPYAVSVPMSRHMFRNGHLASRSAEVIEKIARFLRKHRRWRTVVATNGVETAQQGAASVRRTLIARGIRPERVRIRRVPDAEYLSIRIHHPH